MCVFWKPCFQAKQWERDACFALAAQLRGQPGGWAVSPRPKEVMSPLFHPNSLYPWATKSWDFCPGFLTGMETLGSLDFKRLLHPTLLTCCIPSCISPTSCSRSVCHVHFTRQGNELWPKEGKLLSEGHTTAK